MKYKRLISAVFLSAALSLPASAYTVTPVDEAPQWQIDWSGDYARPGWTDPDGSTFENWSVMLVKIEEELHPYVSADDQLALFVGDELRGLASPSVDVSTDEVDATQFLLKIYGNENLGDEMALTMKYYNAQLRQLFSLSETILLDQDVLVGFDEDFIPPFTLGAAKYPLITPINLEYIIPSADIVPAEGDIAAAFVGGECRAVLHLSPLTSPLPLLSVFQSEAVETITVKYYDSTEDRIVTFEGCFTGDTNGDGVTDVADVSAIISFMSASPNHSEGREKQFDVNGDGVVDVADIATTISIMSAK